MSNNCVVAGKHFITRCNHKKGMVCDACGKLIGCCGTCIFWIKRVNNPYYGNCVNRDIQVNFLMNREYTDCGHHIKEYSYDKK